MSARRRDRGLGRARRRNIVRHELICHRNGDQVGDLDKREADNGENRRQDEQLTRAAEGIPETDQGEQSKEAAQNDEPRADEEGAARVVDVVDPVDRALTRLRDDRLHTTPSGEGDTDDEGECGQDRAESPRAREIDLVHRPSSLFTARVASLACQAQTQ